MDPRKPLVYVAGPYTKGDPVINTRAAVLEGERLELFANVDVYIPHLTLLWHIISPAPIDKWYERDNAVLLRCDAVFRMPGQSAGADAEVKLASENGIPVFMLIENLKDHFATRTV